MYPLKLLVEFIVQSGTGKRVNDPLVHDPPHPRKNNTAYGSVVEVPESRRIEITIAKELILHAEEVSEQQRNSISTETSLDLVEHWKVDIKLSNSNLPVYRGGVLPALRGGEVHMHIRDFCAFDPRRLDVRCLGRSSFARTTRHGSWSNVDVAHSHVDCEGHGKVTPLNERNGFHATADILQNVL